MDDLLKIAVPVVVGVLSGVLTSLLAPWVTWGIEKKRSLIAARREFLKECRELIHSAPPREQFRNSSVYARLLPLLSLGAKELIEDETTTIYTGGRVAEVDSYARWLFDEIARIEREWGLL